jgi:segregation and condensation protein B
LGLLFTDDLKAIIESLLFVSNKPLTVKEVSEIINLSQEETEKLLEDLYLEYQKNHRGFTLAKLAYGYLFITKKEHAPFIEKLYKPKLSNLSTAALETLAIIAYKQPITRSEIELLRGVKVDKIIYTLIDRNLIEEVGRREGPGRPILYGTTRDFLQYFGLNDISQLPHPEKYALEEA